MNHQGGCGVSPQKQRCWRPNSQSRDGSASFLLLPGSWVQFVLPRLPSIPTMNAFTKLSCLALATTFMAILPSSAPASDRAPNRAAHRLLASTRPLVIGHRGYAALAPENTLASFHHALLAGVDLVELDYHHSRDAVPIVIHDGTLDRTTDATQRWNGENLRVADRTANELITLRSGLRFQPPFPDETLPTLLAALEFIQGRGVTLIERKAGDAQSLADLLTRRDLVNQVVVQAFDWTFLRDLHRILPDQVLGALGPPSSKDGRKLSDPEKFLRPSWLHEIRHLGAQAAVWNGLVDADSVTVAHQLGLKVWVYTINDATRATELLRIGVDGIISDNPGLIWRSLALRESM